MNKLTAGFVRGRWTSNERHYYEEALDFYEEVVFINPYRVYYSFDRKTKMVRVQYGTMLLNDLAMLYTFGRVEETLLLVRCLEICGCPISDPYQAISRNSLDKLADTINLLPGGSGTNTYVIISEEMAQSCIESLDDSVFPLLNKPIAGNKGKGIIVLADRQAALDFCRKHFKESKRFLVFEQLMEYSHEYRVYVVDGFMVEAYEKVRKDGREDVIVMNLHQGAYPQNIDPQIKQRIFTWLEGVLPNQYRLGIYGIDVATTTNGEHHVIEINRTPGFSGLQKLGALNFPRFVHSILRPRARVLRRNKNTGQYIITLLGDTNPGESYQLRLKDQGKASIDSDRGYEQCFAPFRGFLRESDFTVANLECCVTQIRSSPFETVKPYLDWTDIVRTPQLLRELPIHAVCIANNHALDFGPEGLSETCAILDSNQIARFGAGISSSEAAKALNYEIEIGNNRLEVIIVSGFEFRQNHKDWGYYATSKQAGVNSWSRKQAQKQVSEIRSRSPKAFLIAFPHWGSNYLPVTDRQRELGRLLVDAGADLVVGHGSHMLQEIEQYKERWLVYGLGNFIFNSPGRFHQHEVLPFGLLARLNIFHKNNGFDIIMHLYPIHVDNRTNSYQPSFLTTNQFHDLLSFLMPDRGERTGLEEKVRCGHDQHGFYIGLDIGYFFSN